MKFSLEVACLVEFRAVVIVSALASKMLNFPPEVEIWWTLMMHFWKVVNTICWVVGWLVG